MSGRTFICLDPSGSHLSYTFGTIIGKSVEITEVGMLWTKSTWSRGQRFDYMYKCLDFLINRYPGTPYDVISEAFFSNPKLAQGQTVVPIINGLVEMLASRDDRMTFELIGPPVWRSILGLKHTVGPDGKRDYKTPAKNIVEKTLGPIPEAIKSNMTMKDRATPTDVADSMCIALAFAKRSGCTEFTVSRVAFLPLSIIDELHKIAQTI